MSLQFIKKSFTQRKREYDKMSVLQKKEFNDCSVTTLSIACNLDYDKAHRILKADGRKDFKGFQLYDWMVDKKGCCGYLFKEMQILNWVKDVPKQTVEKFVTINSEGTFIVFINAHVFALIDGILYDEGTFVKSRKWLQAAFEVIKE